jgi:hypothetical protein
MAVLSKPSIVRGHICECGRSSSKAGDYMVDKAYLLELERSRQVGAQSLRSGEELPFKLREDVADGIRHLHEYSRDRLTFESLKLAERYSKGHLNIAIKFRVAGVVEDYQAVSVGSQIGAPKLNWPLMVNSLMMTLVPPSFQSPPIPYAYWPD